MKLINFLELFSQKTLNYLCTRAGVQVCKGAHEQSVAPKGTHVRFVASKGADVQSVALKSADVQSVAPKDDIIFRCLTIYREMLKYKDLSLFIQRLYT